MTRADDHTGLADSVDELTRPRTHREPYSHLNGANKWVHGAWVTKVASLIDQLGEAIEPGGTGDSGHGVPASRPAARLEAIDTLLLIECECSQWIGTLDLHERPTLAGNLHAIVGVASDMDETQLHQAAKSASRWVTMARVTTGWDVPAWKPDNSCPLCAVKGGLRVRAGDGISSSEASACCVLCSETWTPGTIGLLAEHIRAENLDEPMRESA